MAKTLSGILQGVKKSEIVDGSTGTLPGVDYAPKSEDGQKFVALHKTEKHADRVGNGEDVYGGGTKESKMSRHGYQKPKDVQVYQKANEAKDEGEYGYEGDMAISQLKSLMRNANQLISMLKPDTDLPEWVQSKITLAEDYITTAANYMMSEMTEAKMCESCGKAPCSCDSDDMPKGKKGKKLLLDKQLKEREMTKSEKAREEILKNKYDDSDMKSKMVGQYGKGKGEQIYFAYIRKKAMGEQAPADTSIATPSGLVGDTGRV